MTARILLVRHGRSAHVVRGWQTASSILAWQRAYAAADLAADDRPPPSLIAAATAADVVVSSDLPRALGSAAVLTGSEVEVVSSPLLREAEMPVPDLGGARLPFVAWSLVIGARWSHGRRRGEIPSDELRARVHDAAAMLAGHAGSDRTVMAVTHGTIRTLIAEALAAAGWSREPGGERYAYWGVWAMRR